MAKVQQKSEKISAFGGIFFVLDKFDRILSSVIDSHLGLRSKLIGYQYSEIIRAVFSGESRGPVPVIPRPFTAVQKTFLYGTNAFSPRSLLSIVRRYPLDNPEKKGKG